MYIAVYLTTMTAIELPAMKSIRQRGAEHVARMGGIRNTYRIFVGISL
jgi:hypothetical protein